MWVALWDVRVSGRAMSAREVALDARDARRSVVAAGSVLFVSLNARIPFCTSLHFPVCNDSRLTDTLCSSPSQVHIDNDFRLMDPRPSLSPVPCGRGVPQYPSGAGNISCT